MEERQTEIALIFDEFEKLFKAHCTCLSDWQLFYELKKKYVGCGERDADISRETEIRVPGGCE